LPAGVFALATPVVATIRGRGAAAGHVACPSLVPKLQLGYAYPQKLCFDSRTVPQARAPPDRLLAIGCQVCYRSIFRGATGAIATWSKAPTSYHGRTFEASAADYPQLLQPP
jgi:hypothetical protein